MNVWFRTAAFLMMIGVALGAFGAHGLKPRLSVESMQIYQTAVFYHLIHALGLFAVAWAASLASDRGQSAVRLSGRLLTSGIVIFCGSLYLLAVTNLRWLGAVTPLGGICFLIGWAALASAAFLPAVRR